MAPFLFIIINYHFMANRPMPISAFFCIFGKKQFRFGAAPA